MSAESPRRTTRCIPAIVPPQAVNDRSIIDSVAGFINDVTLTSLPQIDPKDSILWVRFETTADIGDLTFGNDWDLEGNVSPPLLLILGYGTGIQIYAIPATGEAIEVLSWRYGSVKVLRILPTPIIVNNELADEPLDQYADERPLIALCDSSSTTSIGSQYCSVNFISLKTGEQIKSIKFKYPIVDILANRSSIVITFSERIAVFDARNFEDRLTVTTCHPSPGLNPNPVALGSRWMAYAERKLIPSKRSSGGCDCDGVSSYTANFLNVAKSLGKGLLELGEQVAAGLTGSTGQSTSYSTVGGGGGSSGGSSGGGSGIGNTSGGNFDDKQPGIITILDIKYPIKDISPTTGTPISANGYDPIMAHFVAHTDAIVAMQFDYSGMLLLTADKRGHDFHVFRIQTHPGGSSSAAIHHLYVLHRGDTTAKVQDISFSLDSRWVAISTVRGTTHVFPMTPYGGPIGLRTHGSSRVVNRLSRFRRSAGLSVDGRSNSPVYIHAVENSFNQIANAYNNPRIPPFPHPTVVLPLAQLRQPLNLHASPSSSSSGSISSSSSLSSLSSSISTSPLSTTGINNVPLQSGAGSSSANQILYKNIQHNRQRLTSLSDDSVKPLRVCSTFARSRAWLLEPPGTIRENQSHRMQRKTIDSLFIIAGHGALIQYDLEAKHVSNVPKEKVCDDTSIELEVEAKAQWNLLRRDSTTEIQAPLPLENWLLKDPTINSYRDDYNIIDEQHTDDRWLSQVEITTHAGPHRRLWMGPQFVFKTYNTPSGAPLSHIDSESVEIDSNSHSGNRPARSNPMNMPQATIDTCNRATVPVLIESGSCSSYEQSPRLIDRYEPIDTDYSLTPGDSQLREDLADAMRESPSCYVRDTTDCGTSFIVSATLNTEGTDGGSGSGGGGGDSNCGGTGIQTICTIEQEELSSSSFSSTSRASLDPPSSSPTASCTFENTMPFYGD